MLRLQQQQQHPIIINARQKGLGTITRNQIHRPNSAHDLHHRPYKHRLQSAALWTESQSGVVPMNNKRDSQ